METPDLVVNLSLKRCYHHEGRLCRVFYVAESGSEIRRKGLKTHELELAQAAAWAAARYYRTPPKGIRLVYHVLAADPNAPAIAEAWVVDLPLEPRAKVEARLAKRLQAIEAALALPDDRLPECDLDERHGTEARPFQKCFGYCLARKTCPQFARHLAKKAEEGRTLSALFTSENNPRFNASLN